MWEKWCFVDIFKLIIIVSDDQQGFSKKLMYKLIVNANKSNSTSSLQLVSSSHHTNSLTQCLQLSRFIIVVLTPSIFSIRGICLSLSENVIACRRFMFFCQVDVCHKTSFDAISSGWRKAISIKVPRSSRIFPWCCSLVKLARQFF